MLKDTLAEIDAENELMAICCELHLTSREAGIVVGVGAQGVDQRTQHLGRVIRVPSRRCSAVEVGHEVSRLF